MYENKLIYGKNPLTRIVSVEPNGDDLIVFREEADGTIQEVVLPATYWLLTNRSISSKETKLEGNQFFRYFHELPSLEAKQEVKKKLYQKRADFYSVNDEKDSNMLINGMTHYKGMQLQDVSVLSWDIESDGLVKTKDSEIYIITNTFRKNNEVIRKAFYLDEFKSQGAMLETWCAWVREMNPSLMIGHNIFGYDFGYLAHVSKLHNVQLNLGRDGSVLRFKNYESKFRKDGSQDYEFFDAYVYGREVVDTMFLAIKYDTARNFISYGLKPIIKQLGKEKPGRTFIDAGSMKQIYNNRHKDPEMWAKAKLYAIEDSDDALTLFDLMAPSFFYFAQSVSMPFQNIINKATGSQINNMMVRSYLQDGHSVAQASEAEKFEGAISFGVPGIYKNTFKQDVASLYPSIMRQYGIYDSKKDPKGNFKELVETFTLERLKNKKLAKDTGDKYYNDLQEGQKIAINSMYGFMGSQGLNYNSPVNAALVTKYGREILEKAVIYSTGKDVQYWKQKAGIVEEVINE